MDMIFLYVSMGLILLGFGLYFLLILIGRSKKVSNSSSFDVTKDIISEYDSINVIESKNYFTIYNIKRRVIKIDKGCYYGKDLSSISLSLMEAGVSIVDKKKNKYIDILRNIFSNLKILYIFPLIALFINNSSFNVSDAKVSIVFLVIFIFISYIVLDIRNQGCYFVSENLGKIKDINKDNCEKIVNFMNKLIMCDKLIYFGEMVMIIRFILIMLDIG